MKIIATGVRVEGACLSNIRAVQSAKAKLHEGYIYIEGGWDDTCLK